MHTTLMLSVDAGPSDNGLLPGDALKHAVWTLIPEYFPGSIRQVTFNAPVANKVPWEVTMSIAIEHLPGADPDESEDDIVEQAEIDMRSVMGLGKVQVTLDEVYTQLVP